MWTLYDGSSPIMDFSGSGALEVRYLQGPSGILARGIGSNGRGGSIGLLVEMVGPS